MEIRVIKDNPIFNPVILKSLGEKTLGYILRQDVAATLYHALGLILRQDVAATLYHALGLILRQDVAATIP